MGKRLLSALKRIATRGMFALALLVVGLGTAGAGIGMLFGTGWALVVLGAAMAALALFAVDVEPRRRR